MQQFCKPLAWVVFHLQGCPLPFTGDTKCTSSFGISIDSFIAEGSESACVLHFYKNKWYFSPMKCHIKWSYLFFALLRQKESAFSFSVKFVALVLILALLLVSLPLEFVYLSHLDPPLPGNHLLAHGRTAEHRLQRAFTAQCAMRANPAANWRLAWVPKNMVCACVWCIRVFKQSGLVLQSYDCSLPAWKYLLIMGITN